MFHVNPNPDRLTLRIFALAPLVFCLVAAIIGLWDGIRGGWFLPAVIAATAFAAGGLIRPDSLRPVYIGWTYIVAPVAVVVTVIALAMTYYLVLTPIALLLRLSGRMPAPFRSERRPSYWSPREGPRDPSSYWLQH